MLAWWQCVSGQNRGECGSLRYRHVSDSLRVIRKEAHDQDCGPFCWYGRFVVCTRVVAVWKLILIPPRAWQLMWKPVVTRRAVSQGW